jgi:hypothetical protein
MIDLPVAFPSDTHAEWCSAVSIASVLFCLKMTEHARRALTFSGSIERTGSIEGLALEDFKATMETN